MVGYSTTLHSAPRTLPPHLNLFTPTAAAAYYLARYLEGMTEVQEAINYYAQSGCYNHAIRLAKNFGLDSELMSYAIKSRPSLMVGFGDESAEGCFTWVWKGRVG